MELALKWLTLASAALFATWASYVSLVEHPARLAAGMPAAVAQFRASYRRAAPWQASAAAVSLVSGAATSWLTADWTWGLGGLAAGIAIPFTLMAMMPTNHRLFAMSAADAEAGAVLVRWGRLHAVRTALGLLGLVVLLSRVDLR